MNRAFVKESDADDGDALPDRPQSEHPNYVTPAGYLKLQQQMQALERRRESLAASAAEDISARAELREVERDLRYLNGSFDRAAVVDPKTQPRTDIRFGATVTLADSGGAVHEFTIVGEDETCAPTGHISWVSPLARAMLGKRVGDSVTWDSPDGPHELEVIAFHYGEA